MFTGIVQTTGKLTIKTTQKITISDILDSGFLFDLRLGMSIAVNGVCLTVVSFDDNSFTVDVMDETFNVTNLGLLNVNDFVNLEKAMLVNDRLEGHIVQGHVDTISKLLNINNGENYYMLKFELPISVSKYVAKKGSIAINGISLTVVDVGADWFSVGVIPHTLDVTMLKGLKVGDMVNLEVDVLAKYVERMMM